MQPPDDLQQLLDGLDAFIAAEVVPLQDSHPQFFDHRREFARTDVDNDGVPAQEWEELLGEMVRRADAAGFWRYALPVELGGSGGTNLGIAFVREYLANKPLRLHSELQTETSAIGNFPLVPVLPAVRTAEQKRLI